MSSKINLLDGIISGLVEDNPDVSPQYQPKLILNDYLKGTKTLEYITNNISSCESFILAVAFVTRSGVACIHQTLKEFGARGGSGTILVSTYLNFSDPTAIEKLSKFEGIEVKFVNSPNFHGKTYLFEHNKHADIMIGSSNLTQNALGKNTEANIGLSVARESSLYNKFKEQLKIWSNKSDHVTEDGIENYRERWEDSRKHTNVAHEDIPSEVSIEWPVEKADLGRSNAIVPNLMQEQALERLAGVREKGNNRSLIISATGTGKTVLSALDVKNFNAKKLLFVVHRLNICRKALSEFKRVFGESKSMSIYCAEESLDKSADFVFSTVQTINKDHHLKEFNTKEFDYIIIDETHRAGAKTYQRILDYFTPKFLLGMTATPERTDGFDIFSLFNHSVAYEIRLQNAMHADLLAPFHYFGVTDISVDGEPLNDDSDFNKLMSKERIDHLINTLNEYGCDSGTPRGLIFCAKVEEARELSRLLNDKGLKTLPLTGEDSADSRENAIRKLESDDTDKLDYLITVDVFNEGVDIPRVNLVVMLRPTSSAIIFVQQLGRGLRKSIGKEYVTVIDFIGNYKNNYLIPVALFGDSSFSKDRLRKLLSAGSSLIPGSSSISFEQIARERVFASIDSSKLNTKKALTEDFNLLKFRLGRPPLMADFINNKSRDPYQYVSYSGSLLAFTIALGECHEVPHEGLQLLEYLSKYVCDGIRIEEVIILRELLTKESLSIDHLKDTMLNMCGFHTEDTIIANAIHNLNLHYVTKRVKGQEIRLSEATGFKIVEFDSDKLIINRGASFTEITKNNVIFEYTQDVCTAAIKAFMLDFNPLNYVGGFKRGSKYSRRDVFRILRWDKLPNAQNVGGYIVSQDKTNCPIFVTYHKGENISETTRYEDHFINPRHVVYMSKSRRTLTSPEVVIMRKQYENKIRLPFFVKKDDDEGTAFYYLGDLTSIPDKFENTTMQNDSGGSVSVVKMEYLLDRDVEPRLFSYLTEKM
ncbi:MAG: DUF3427 domain-containing protein [Flavobacteriales bacterium]|nr:DUF3427 domain-containing protein [Flavobacteriales bacterium]